MDKNTQKLIADIASNCIKHKINFRLEYTDQVDKDTIPCSGYFNEETLTVAVNKPRTIDWLDILVHESCHLDQFVEGSKLWASDDDSLNIVEGWINGKPFTHAKLIKGFGNTVALELDCEKRTVKKLQKYKIKFNKNEYIQRANAYLFSYSYTLINKKWYETPYEKPTIYKKMPNKFLTLDKYLDPKSQYLQYFK